MKTNLIAKLLIVGLSVGLAAFGFYGEAALALASVLVPMPTFQPFSHNLGFVNCNLSNIGTNSADCNLRGGILKARWANCTDIDWGATLADPTKFLPADANGVRRLAGLVMNAGKSFKGMNFQKKSASYTNTYTSDADVYAVEIRLLFEGRDAAKSKAISEAARCCCIVMIIVDANGEERLFGQEFDGTQFVDPIERLRITTHTDSSGVFGESKATDEIILTAEHLDAPLYGVSGAAGLYASTATP